MLFHPCCTTCAGNLPAAKPAEPSFPPLLFGSIKVRAGSPWATASSSSLHVLHPFTDAREREWPRRQPSPGMYADIPNSS